MFRTGLPAPLFRHRRRQDACVLSLPGLSRLSRWLPHIGWPPCEDDNVARSAETPGRTSRHPCRKRNDADAYSRAIDVQGASGPTAWAHANRCANTCFLRHAFQASTLPSCSVSLHPLLPVSPNSAFQFPRKKRVGARSDLLPIATMDRRYRVARHRDGLSSPPHSRSQRARFPRKTTHVELRRVFRSPSRTRLSRCMAKQHRAWLGPTLPTQPPLQH